MVMKTSISTSQTAGATELHEARLGLRGRSLRCQSREASRNAFPLRNSSGLGVEEKLHHLG